MIAKAIALLHRWLEHDGLPEPNDATLDDETNDLLLAYSLPRAELDQAVLDAMAAVSDEHVHWFALHSHPVWKAELARRKALLGEIEQLESRTRIVSVAGARLGMHVPSSTEIVILQVPVDRAAPTRPASRVALVVR
jgi:hypothetical protein